VCGYTSTRASLSLAAQSSPVASLSAVAVRTPSRLWLRLRMYVVGLVETSTVSFTRVGL